MKEFEAALKGSVKTAPEQNVTKTQPSSTEVLDSMQSPPPPPRPAPLVNIQPQTPDELLAEAVGRREPVVRWMGLWSSVHTAAEVQHWQDAPMQREVPPPTGWCPHSPLAFPHCLQTCNTVCLPTYLPSPDFARISTRIFFASVPNSGPRAARWLLTGDVFVPVPASMSGPKV